MMIAKFYTQYGQVSEAVQDTIVYGSQAMQPQVPIQNVPTNLTQQQRASAIAKIKQQLIAIMTQLIHLLTLQAGQAGR